ncbi:MAG: diguanylate cyclase [Erythrobacter sp.]
MGFVRPLPLFVILAGLLLSLWGQPALAHEPSIAIKTHVARCHAATGLDVSIAQMALVPDTSSESLWVCSDEGWTASHPVGWLRFESASWAGDKLPRYFFSRIARHQSITFTALDQDGTMRTRTWQEADARPFAAGPVFQLALPEITDQTAALLVRIERPHSIPLLTEARLTHSSEEADWSQIEVLTLAIVLGMLVLPLLFDISFFLVLRERFVLLHAVMVVAMMGYVLFAGGLISVFATFSLATIAVAAPLTWAIGVGVSALFLAEFLEDGAQSEIMRKLTIAAGIWAICMPGFFALQLHVTQPVDDALYFYTFVPVILIITAAIAEAVGRGSRSACFIAVAWTPIILASIDRMARGIGVYVGPSSLDQTMYIATGMEVVVISLAIADRFLAIRRERDAAVTEARMMERLSERDALTGLLNRRGLEAQFEEFLARGFDTFALIDLDRFKQVNDTHGHQVGDAALVACANVLRNNYDRDLVAARLGGEEFVVLLRGQQTVQRTEALRVAIPLRIATEVEGLEMPVTASVGMVEVPRSGHAMMDFDQLYARADELMYEAKESGRNRMMYERLTVFPRPRAAAPQTRANRSNRVA